MFYIFDSYRCCLCLPRIWSSSRLSQTSILLGKIGAMPCCPGSIFRSFQGWLSLSSAGQGRGALLLAPLLREAGGFPSLQALVIRIFKGSLEYVWNATTVCFWIATRCMLYMGFIQSCPYVWLCRCITYAIQYIRIYIYITYVYSIYILYAWVSSDPRYVA